MAFMSPEHSGEPRGEHLRLKAFCQVRKDDKSPPLICSPLEVAVVHGNLPAVEAILSFVASAGESWLDLLAGSVPQSEDRQRLLLERAILCGNAEIFALLKWQWPLSQSFRTALLPTVMQSYSISPRPLGEY